MLAIRAKFRQMTIAILASAYCPWRIKQYRQEVAKCHVVVILDSATVPKNCCSTSFFLRLRFSFWDIMCFLRDISHLELGFKNLDLIGF